MLRFALISFALMLPLTASVAAQPFQYDARWFTGVRDNILTIQERQRARIEANERRRAADERARLGKTVEEKSLTVQSAPVPLAMSSGQ